MLRKFRSTLIVHVHCQERAWANRSTGNDAEVEKEDMKKVKIDRTKKLKPHKDSAVFGGKRRKMSEMYGKLIPQACNTGRHLFSPVLWSTKENDWE